MAVLLAASCGEGDGGRGFGLGGGTATDPGDESDEADDNDPLDTISASASATQGGTSAGPTSDGPSSDPSGDGPDPSSSTAPTASDSTSDSTTAASMSGSSSADEAEVTTSCDRLAVTWGDCLNYGVAQCENDEATCIVDDPADSTLGTCALLDCVNDCDCPDPPATGNADSRCDAILVGGQTACYLNCSNAATCPDGMVCWQSQICMFPDIVCMDPAPEGAYADCVDTGTDVCGGSDALCLVDDPDAAMTGVCAFTGCITDCDCPAAPATGDAPVACAPIVADSEENACFLDCSAGQTCPDGMTCFMDFLCMWP